ncbi:MAG: TonB C-terminal domain-containing protein [Woeseiaceae bacterium]
MKQKYQNVGPAILSVLLHAGLAASLIVVLDFDKTPDIAVPLALNATLVTENAVVIPPQVEEPPKIEEKPVPPPPKPEPDTAEQDRIAAEKVQREKDAAEEKARLQKIEDEKAEAERKRLAEEERQRKEKEAEEERRRIEAEEQRKADIERQRLENERLRMEAEDAAREAELEAESQQMAAMAASAKSAYIFAIQQKITRNWVQPPTAEEGLDCVVKVQQTAGGEVLNVSFGGCNGDATVRRSIEAAVYKASPLPAPRDPSVFDRNLELRFIT